MKWKITIEKVDNGYMVEYLSEMGDGNEKTLFEENEEDDINCMQRLLYFIKEHFGIYYSKHNKKNLVINIEETNK